MTKRYSIQNLKGGISKTTTTANLAYALAHAGNDVLIIDTDQQNQIASYYGADGTHGLDSVILSEKTPQQAAIQARDNIAIIAAGHRLPKAKIELQSMPYSDRQITMMFKDYERQFDYVLIDNAPGFDVLTISIMAYAKNIIAPVGMSSLDAESLRGFISRIDELSEYDNEINIALVVPSLYDPRNKITTVFHEQLIEAFGGKLTSPIRLDTKLRECHHHGQTIFEYAPNSRGAFDYVELAKKVMTI